jgi:anthranilate/para-aminobenzoate synthase component II
MGKTVMTNFLKVLKRVWSGTLSLLGCRSDFERTEATSFDENGQVMSLRHRTFDVRGVQFHGKCVDSNGKKVNLGKWLVYHDPTEKRRRWSN